MSSAYYEIYLKGVFDLASTLVIKSEDTAEIINNWLKAALYQVDDQDPTTWKYYLNLAGQYHQSDVPMTIISMDNHEEIPFTVENLSIHLATKREYTYRSRHYKELVARYPEQEQLILGILNPIDLDVAIGAADHTILYYDENHVEASETPFIPKLQAWINAFFARWDVTDYRLTDSLYTASQLGVLFAHLPKAVLNIRLELAKTNYAHSFHIHQYLSSFGNLERFLEFLTHKQKLFLYRNIRYINRNNGKVDIFEWLTEKLLTDRRFPLAEYNLRHNTAKQPDELYPIVELERQTINGISSALGTDIKSVNAVLEMENPLARGNPAVQEVANDVIFAEMKNSLASQVKTKVLESNVLDTTDAEPFTLTEVLLNHWIYLSATGRYQAVLSVTNPGTGEEMRVSAKDAFMLYLYAYNKARGVTFTHLPDLEAMRVRREPLPTREELLSVVNTKVVDPRFIDHALKNQPILGKYISIDSFRNACVDVHQAMLRHRDLYAYRQHFRVRGEVKQMVNRFYMNYPVLGGGQAFKPWFSERGFQIEQLTDLELDLLATDLYIAATGVESANNRSLKDIHQAMLNLHMTLSSYSIQLIQQINTGSLKIIDWPRLRPGDFNYKGSHLTQVKLPEVTQLSPLKTRGRAATLLSVKRLQHARSSGMTYRLEQLKVGVSVGLLGRATSGGRVRLGMQITALEEPVVQLSDLAQDEMIEGYGVIEPMPLESIFNSTSNDAYAPLTPLEKTSLTR